MAESIQSPCLMLTEKLGKTKFKQATLQRHRELIYVLSNTNLLKESVSQNRSHTKSVIIKSSGAGAGNIKTQGSQVRLTAKALTKNIGCQ